MYKQDGNAYIFEHVALKKEVHFGNNRQKLKCCANYDLNALIFFCQIVKIVAYLKDSNLKNIKREKDKHEKMGVLI